MILTVAIGVLLVISFVWAFFSLRKELKRTEHEKAKEVQKDLSKGRVLFYAPSAHTPLESTEETSQQ